MKKLLFNPSKPLIILGLPVLMFIASCASNSAKEEKNTNSAVDISAPPPPEGEAYSNASGYKKTESQNWKGDDGSNKLADSVSAENNVYKPMATGKLNDTNHVFMRNADMRCSVKDVRKACFAIEEIVRKYDGYVTYTSLNGNKYLNNSVQVTKDSILQTYSLNVYNDITLRIPNENLDSALIEMNELIDFIDNRTIKAEDIKLQLLALSLKAKRNTKHIQGLNNAVVTQGKKLPNTVDALKEIDNTRESFDQQLINSLELQDKVSYSTVKLYVYQPEIKEYKKVLKPIEIEAYKPSFGDKIASTGKSSIVILEYLVLFFVIIWPFLFVLLITWLVIRFLIRKKVFARIFKV